MRVARDRARGRGLTTNGARDSCRGEQACNDDVDAAVDAFFNGTLDARVDAAAARDGGEDVGGAVPGDA